MSRRALPPVAAVAAVAVAALVASTVTPTSASGSTAGERVSRTLRDGSPQQAGLVTAPVEQMEADLESFLLSR